MVGCLSEMVAVWVLGVPRPPDSALIQTHNICRANTPTTTSTLIVEPDRLSTVDEVSHCYFPSSAFQNVLFGVLVVVVVVGGNHKKVIITCFQYHSALLSLPMVTTGRFVFSNRINIPA